MKRCVQGFVTLSLMGWLAIAGAAALALSGLTIWAQSQKIDTLQATLKTIEAIGEAAQKEAAKRQREDKLKKEKADEDYKTVSSALAAANRKLRDYASRSILPSAAPGSRESKTSCFSRPQLDGALQTFTSGIAELIAECELSKSALENARRWAEGL